jgi:hypothetical protein
MLQNLNDILFTKLIGLLSDTGKYGWWIEKLDMKDIVCVTRRTSK